MTPGLGNHPRIPDRIPAEPDVAVTQERLTERDRLGRGATADVVAMDVAGTDETVAVKQPQLAGTLRAGAVEEFVAEAETWAKLDGGDHVVGVVDWGTTPVPWIALELMDGGSLADRIGELSTEEALWIGACAADGVWSAHRQGVAHLDLKPENVLFRTTEPGVWDVPKVSDWGLARLLLEASPGVEGLSPRYASPEQLDPETYGRPDDRSDIYQLGTVVYELLTGEPPFDGPAATVTERHLNESPPPPTAVDPTLPSAADDVVLGALAKEKGDRYESMLDLRRALESLFDRVAGAPSDHGRTPRGGRLDPLESGPTEDEAGADPLAGGSSIDSGSDGRRILDRIREQSAADRERQIPWQGRDDPPGLDPDDADDGPNRSGAGADASDRGATADRPTDGAEPAAPSFLAGVGAVVGLFVAVAGLLGIVAGGPVVAIAGIGIVGGALWLLASGE